MVVPFYGLDRFFLRHKEVLEKLTSEVMASGQYFNEKYTQAFEARLALQCHRKYAISTGSCTDALFFALMALGIRQGDKVVVPSVSFMATVTPVMRAGAVPVFADVDPVNGLICAKHLEKLMQQHEIKAVIGVDLYGNLPGADLVKRVVQHFHVPYIEDAAQSIGSVRDGAVAGSMGTISCVSFDPTKVIHAFGSGGAVLTDDASVADKIRRLRYHGKSGNEHLEHGYNSRINATQAVLLNFQLEVLDDIIASRNHCAKSYDNAIAGKKSLHCLTSPNSLSNFHKYVIVCDDRDGLKLFLEQRGIQTMIHYPRPLFSYELFRNSPHVAEGITETQPFCDKVLTLPLHTFMKEEDLLYICDTLQQIP